MTENKPVDFNALTRGLLQDLRDAYSSRPPLKMKRSESSGITQIEEVAARVRVERDAGLEPIEARYRKRADSNAAILNQRQKRIEAYAKRERRAVPADPEKSILAGRVLDASSGVGLPNVKVNAFDAERKFDEALGSANTDALGYFRLEYTAKELEKLGRRPRAYIEVLDEEETAIFTTEKAFPQKVGNTEFVSVEIDGNKVPTRRDLGKRIDKSVSGRIKGIQRRSRIAKPRGRFPLRNLRRRTMPELMPGLEPEREPEPAPKPEPSRKPKPERGPEPTQKAEPAPEVKPKPGGRGVPPQVPAVLEDLKGIGRRFASRLGEAGVTAISEIAEMEPERLAKILKTSSSRAESIVVEARRVAHRG